jgi:hypothetical protein
MVAPIKPFPGMRGAKILEKDVTRAVRQFLNIKKIWHFKVMQGLGCVPGIPDIIAIDYEGRFVGIEVKAPGGKQSEHQKEIQRQIEAAGGIYLLIKDVEELRGRL